MQNCFSTNTPLLRSCIFLDLGIVLNEKLSLPLIWKTCVLQLSKISIRFGQPRGFPGWSASILINSFVWSKLEYGSIWSPLYTVPIDALEKEISCQQRFLKHPDVREDGVYSSTGVSNNPLLKRTSFDSLENRSHTADLNFIYNILHSRCVRSWLWLHTILRISSPSSTSSVGTFTSVHLWWECAPQWMFFPKILTLLQTVFLN